jgi:hypothetical protein
MEKRLELLMEKRQGPAAPAHRPRLTGAARRQKDERVRLTRLYDRGHGHDPAARPPLRGLRLRERRHRLRSAGLVVLSREKR